MSKEELFSLAFQLFFCPSLNQYRDYNRHIYHKNSMQVHLFYGK